MGNVKIEPEVYTKQCNLLNKELNLLESEIETLNSNEPDYLTLLTKIRGEVNVVKEKLEDLISQSRNLSQKNNSTRTFLWGTIDSYSDIVRKVEQAEEFPYTFAKEKKASKKLKNKQKSI